MCQINKMGVCLIIVVVENLVLSISSFLFVSNASCLALEKEREPMDHNDHHVAIERGEDHNKQGRFFLS
jgi:hypothetical protein